LLFLNYLCNLQYFQLVAWDKLTTLKNSFFFETNLLDCVLLIFPYEFLIEKWFVLANKWAIAHNAEELSLDHFLKAFCCYISPFSKSIIFHFWEHQHNFVLFFVLQMVIPTNILFLHNGSTFTKN
jgi:hypothetical protein